MPRHVPTKRIEIDGRAQPRIFRGVVFSFLSLGQMGFAFVFAYRFYILSQTRLATIDSRWIFPVIAIVSCAAFALEAWGAFVPKQGHNPQGGANGRQPFSSEANPNSSAAASRRSP